MQNEKVRQRNSSLQLVDSEEKSQGAFEAILGIGLYKREAGARFNPKKYRAAFGVIQCCH